MAQYSPELIEQTVSLFESRTDRVISDEDARQAVENISGFFRVCRNGPRLRTRKDVKTLRMAQSWLKGWSNEFLARPIPVFPCPSSTMSW